MTARASDTCLVLDYVHVNNNKICSFVTNSLNNNSSLPSARQHLSYGDCLEVEGILSELLRAVLCDTMFTVSSTLI